MDTTSQNSEGVQDLSAAIQKTIDEKIVPMLRADGGWCEFVGYNEGIVQVKMMGACGTCPSAMITLKSGIERFLMEEFPEVKSVEQAF
ncbi:MAG: NifU family protein [Candidatus Delongbacteria bacterium]|nr:NifU family protein [Candidatus Delongbacteria bacterium]